MATVLPRSPVIRCGQRWRFPVHTARGEDLGYVTLEVESIDVRNDGTWYRLRHERGALVPDSEGRVRPVRSILIVSRDWMLLRGELVRPTA